MPEIWETPVADASAWRGSDLETDRGWEFVLNDDHRADLDAALATVKGQGLALTEIGADNFPLPALSRTLAQIGAELKSGRGFTLVRGFPVRGYDYDDLERLYWGFCSHIGTGLTQNGEGGLIHYVTDGALRPQQGTRGVGLPKESPLHVDLMDIVSLLCMRQAPDDPPSRVASSTTVYNEILSRRPDALARLYQGFEWDRMNEHGDGEAPTSGYRVPLFSQAAGMISCRYNRTWINNANLRNAAPMTPAECEILDVIDQVAFETCFEFPFHEGDIQFCNNYTVFHGRAAHDVVAEEARKRVLLRIWLDMPDIRPFADEAIVRYGIGRHGQLGWTAADLLAERNQQGRARRSDGAILC